MAWRKIIEDGDRLRLYRDTAEPSRWSIRWQPPDGQWQRRRLLTAPDLDSALAAARIITGIDAPPEQGGVSVEIGAAFVEALRATRRGEKARSDWRYYTLRLLEWLAARHPSARTWDALTRPILREYVADTLAGKSRTLDRTEGLSIAGGTPAAPPATVYLADVLDLLDWIDALDADRLAYPARSRARPDAVLSIDRAVLRAGVALQSLAGLRVQEATRLTWDRVDIDRALIEITGDVKNIGSRRVIPVCRRVVAALAEAWRGRPPRRAAAVLTSPSGVAYGRSWQAYSRAVKFAIDQWNPRAAWKPKDLRNCLTTWAATHGYGGEIWEQYVGRAPRSVAARHYIPRLASATRGESEELDRAMDIFRRLVIEPLEQAIRARGQARVIDVAKSCNDSQP